MSGYRTKKQIAQGHYRTLALIQKKIGKMELDWSDVDNYYVTQLEELRATVAEFEKEFKDDMGSE